jgi:hypothetical protein
MRFATSRPCLCGFGARVYSPQSGAVPPLTAMFCILFQCSVDWLLQREVDKIPLFAATVACRGGQRKGCDMSKKKLRSKVLFTASLCFAALATQAHATQYNVDISGGDASITGSITTDGNLGQLVDTDFLSWNLTVNVGSNSYVLTEVNSTYFWFGINPNNHYDPITATSTGLFEDFNPADATGNQTLVRLDANDGSVGVDGYVNGNSPLINGYFFYTNPTSNVPTDVIPIPGLLHGGISPPLDIQFGTAAVTPLPAALPLFATGLGAMGLFGWRRKRKNTAAIAA